LNILRGSIYKLGSVAHFSRKRKPWACLPRPDQLLADCQKLLAQRLR
jgi:hypothetical protein